MLDEVIELASSLIRYPSVTPYDQGCQDVLIDFLSQLGFQITQYPYQEASNFWAIIGNEGPLFCFAGHTDVVATGPLEQWNSDPFVPTVTDNHLYGRGAADMKSEIAAMCIACKHFLTAYPNFPGRIGFLITSAEEGPSEIGTPIVLEALAKHNLSIDYCLVGEATAVNRTGDMIKNGRRGSLSGKLTLYGKQGHIAYPQIAENPVHNALPALAEFVATQWDHGTEFFQPTSLQISNFNSGTGAGNVIPGEAEVRFNFRYAPVHSGETIMAKTEALFQSHKLKFDIEWDHSGKPFITPGGRLIEITTAAIEDVCGITPILSTSGGTSDGRFIAEYCNEVIECGVNNSTIHQINECVNLTDLQQITDIYYNILTRLFEVTACKS